MVWYSQYPNSYPGSTPDIVNKTGTVGVGWDCTPSQPATITPDLLQFFYRQFPRPQIMPQHYTPTQAPTPPGGQDPYPNHLPQVYYLPPCYLYRLPTTVVRQTTLPLLLFCRPRQIDRRGAWWWWRGRRLVTLPSPPQPGPDKVCSPGLVVLLLPNLILLIPSLPHLPVTSVLVFWCVLCVGGVV